MDITDKFGKASSDTGYATATTVKTARLPGESVLAAFDLSEYATDTPTFFVTYRKVTDPITNEITIEAQKSWKALVNADNNTLTNLTLAPGYTDDGNSVGDYIEPVPTSYWNNELIKGLLVSLKGDGKLKDDAIDSAAMFADAVDPVLRTYEENRSRPFVASGVVWTHTSGLAAGMTAGVVYINGIRIPVSAISTRTFTASVDTWVSVNTSGTVAYAEVGVGATSPTLPANSIWIARIRSNGTTITDNSQGFDPNVSFNGFDSEFNPVYPQPGNFAIARHTSGAAGSQGATGTIVGWNGLQSLSVRTRKGQRYRFTMHEPILDNYTAGSGGGFIQFYIYHDLNTTRSNHVGNIRAALTAGGTGIDGTMEFVAAHDGDSKLNISIVTFNISGTMNITRNPKYPCYYVLEEV